MEGTYPPPSHIETCNSYSRLRWRPAPNLPGPVRSRQHPYGLPGNGEKEQAEADLGTILMCRSIEACKAMAETNDEYKVPAFYTMENPPPSSAGDSQHIAAWEMPEMVKFIESRAEFRKAFFHTCRFQQNVPVGKRMKKPQMFGGNLNGLASLGRMCNCGDAGHVEVVGKEKSKKSGEYGNTLRNYVRRTPSLPWTTSRRWRGLSFGMQGRKSRGSTWISWEKRLKLST